VSVWAELVRPERVKWPETLSSVRCV
jgi:hypothetical protein